MKKILAFAGSNSSSSINHQLVSYAASLISKHEVRLIKLTDYPLELFSEDIEKEKGYSVELRMLLNTIKDADALMISVNEHNGGPSVFFKNVMDWLSRIEYKYLDGKKLLLMSTSTGSRGGASAFDYVKSRIPRHNGELIESFSFPSFNENFSVQQNKIVNEELSLGFIDVIQNFEHQIEE
ncbi:NAD(P)H-dependent oxidoreductase [uncultured Planktosalinus sp.]|uniref:NADPH-dependent FMN reductase n=1 Tax=uncultured Planktosalinus sp. TaxID=1810935 RepID=UPI0030DD456B